MEEMCFSCFQREQRGEEEAATREPQKGPKWLLFSSSLSRFPERQGVAVNQGTAEENGLSEMILLSWNSRVSCGLESELKVQQTLHLVAAIVSPVSVQLLLTSSVHNLKIYFLSY